MLYKIMYNAQYENVLGSTFFINVAQYFSWFHGSGLQKSCMHFETGFQFMRRVHT